MCMAESALTLARPLMVVPLKYLDNPLDGAVKSFCEYIAPGLVLSPKYKATEIFY